MEQYLLFIGQDRVNDAGYRHFSIKPPVEASLQEALEEDAYLTVRSNQHTTEITHTWPITPQQDIIAGIQRAIHAAGHRSEVVSKTHISLAAQRVMSLTRQAIEQAAHPA